MKALLFSLAVIFSTGLYAHQHDTHIPPDPDPIWPIIPVNGAGDEGAWFDPNDPIIVQQALWRAQALCMQDPNCEGSTTAITIYDPLLFSDPDIFVEIGFTIGLTPQGVVYTTGRSINRFSRLAHVNNPCNFWIVCGSGGIGDVDIN